MWMSQSAMPEMTRKTNSLEAQTQAWTRELFSLSAPESQDLLLNLITTGSQTRLEKCPQLQEKWSSWLEKGKGHKTKQGKPDRTMHRASLWPVFCWVSWHTWLSGPSWSLRHISWAGHHGNLGTGEWDGARGQLLISNLLHHHCSLWHVVALANCCLSKPFPPPISSNILNKHLEKLAAGIEELFSTPALRAPACRRRVCTSLWSCHLFCHDRAELFYTLL